MRHSYVGQLAIATWPQKVTRKRRRSRCSSASAVDIIDLVMMIDSATAF